MFVKEVSVSFYRVCSVCKSKNMFVKEVSVSYYRVCSVCKSKNMFVKEVSVSFYRVCSVCKSKNMFVKEVSVSYYRVCSVCKSRFPVTMGKRSTLHGSSTTSACALLLVCLSLKGMNPKVGTGFDQCHPRGMNPKVGTGFNQCRGCLPQRRPPSIFAV